MSDDVKQEENVDESEPESTALYHREVSLREEGTENCVILPFLNFKRRSETQKVAGETKTSCSIESRKSEASLVKHKRRKLLRPSFGEDEVSNEVNGGQEMVDATQELFLKGDGGESNSMDGDRIGNDSRESRCDCSAGETSQGHLIDQVLFTASEHVGDVRSSPMSQSVAKAVKLDSAATTFVKGQSKFQNMQESSQNLCGGPRVVDGNNSGGAGGGKEVEGEFLSLGLNDNVETDASDITYRGQYKFSNLHNPSKIGESSAGIEYDYASDRNASGDERRHGAQYPRDCRGCSCNLEGLSKGHVCQTSDSVIPDIRTEELLSNQFIGHEENLSARVHLTESSIKSTRNAQRNLASTANTEYENICMNGHFTEFDLGNNNDSQRNWVSSTMVVPPLSSHICVLREDASRVTEEKTTVTEKNLEFDGTCKKTSHESPSSCGEEMGSKESLPDPYIIHIDELTDGTTINTYGKRLRNEVADNEMKTSHQPQVCCSERMATGGSLSEPSTAETGNPTANAEEDRVRLERPNLFVQKKDYLIPSGKRLRKQVKAVNKEGTHKV